MQSGSREVDRNASVETLLTLSQRIKCPPGWSFRARVPQTDEVYPIRGTAFVLQDEFRNTYQKIVFV